MKTLTNVNCVSQWALEEFPYVWIGKINRASELLKTLGQNSDRALHQDLG